ncbi:hypothetical protein [Bradyrhizobium sp.]|uniref:hypothetical protein n=1 Tax=Bradyrhizobium sp. TaxID=376 RepID=UPI001DD8279F|nr:hypothetical protein [Bradyrhizobium sp.]MBI5319077.1 hypothetical protein [Bradyrhizobium sp.]
MSHDSGGHGEQVVKISDPARSMRIERRFSLIRPANAQGINLDIAWKRQPADVSDRESGRLNSLSSPHPDNGEDTILEVSEQLL